jgi:hypothetical protein
MKKESEFQRNLIDTLYELFEGCIILKNDPSYIQGFPDLTILWKKRWAVLEVKRSENESWQPNQEYYINYLNRMSFARVVYPENREEVLYDLQRSFASGRVTRLPKS